MLRTLEVMATTSICLVAKWRVVEGRAMRVRPANEWNRGDNGFDRSSLVLGVTVAECLNLARAGTLAAGEGKGTLKVALSAVRQSVLLNAILPLGGSDGVQVMLLQPVKLLLVIGSLLRRPLAR